MDDRKKCGAKTRPGAKHARCQRWAVPGRTRCARHGGKTPKGPDSPHWIHGLGDWGKARKEQPDLWKLYELARTDPELFGFRKDAALLEMARSQILMRLDPAKTLSERTLKRLMEIGDQLRKVKEAEHKRLQLLNAMVPVERHRRAMAMTAQVVADVLRERGEALLSLVESIDNLEQLKTKLRAGLNTREWGSDMAARYRIAALREPSIVVEALTEAT